MSVFSAIPIFNDIVNMIAAVDDAGAPKTSDFVDAVQNFISTMLSACVKPVRNELSHYQ
jgi:hypothetical protein